MKYVNKITGVELTEKEYNEMITREYSELWNDDTDLLVSEFKEDGKTKDEFIKYMIENEIDYDFEIIEE